MLEPSQNDQLPPIPGKRYFGIGEVSELCGVRPHVLRYWEQEFPELTPAKRTGNRRDLTTPPPALTVLDKLADNGGEVISIGKIADIYAHRGSTKKVKATGNAALFDATLEAARAAPDRSIVFTNFVDFDMLYGHRNDVEGYARALEEVDAWLPQLLERLRPGDLLILTADHGCDPTTPSTDHSREYVPLITLGPGARRGVDLGTRDSLADIGQTVAENFGTTIATGLSFLDQIGENPGAPPGGLPNLPVV